ncbi:MAG: type II toxin-antitoxin system VapC family toxin [Microcystis aeruginosa W13-11]|jgi:predicted nucleic acid-binding protein|nr:type II toxin-antitoxin system VapC family toxin [Microcystis aeruginosa W13-11]
MNCFFLDASYIVALELVDDQNHQLALQHWRSLDRKNLKLVTTSYIFDEVVTFFSSRYLHAKAVEIGERLLTSPSVQFIQVDEALFTEGWRLFRQYDDKSYSLTDCISFAIMKQLNINNSLTFDKHFSQVNFTKLP